jgi:hypothetical protein
LPDLPANLGRARSILAQESREGAAIRSVRVGWVLSMRGLRKGSGAGRAAHTPDAWRSNASHYIQTKLMQCLVRVASNTLGFEPRAFRMRSGCDTTTPCAQWRCALGGACCLLIQATLRGQEVSTLARAPPPLPSSPPSPPPPARAFPPRPTCLAHQHGQERRWGRERKR